MKIKVSRKDKILNQEQFLCLLEDFIEDSYSGIRRKKNGAKIGAGSIASYEGLQRILNGFVNNSSFQLKLYVVNRLTQREYEQAKRYYVKFYKSLTKYMYDELDFYDNYVGNVIKTLKTFFNYLNDDRCLQIGTFHKLFYVPSEEVPIITLTKEQLNYIIKNKVFIRKVEKHNLEIVRDIFIFGCTVALRVSDLLALKPNNLVKVNKDYYLRVNSQKTNTFTSIKLPQYCIDILHKYKDQYETILPTSTPAWYHSRLKRFAKLIPDDFELIKTRNKRGKPTIIYKDKKNKIHYKLSDHITTHTMRRTGITVMLNLGMPEHLVRKISGHAPNSKEFYRYVRLSQNYLDSETDRVFKELLKG